MDKVTKTDVLKNARRSFVYLGQDLTDDYLPGVREGVATTKTGISSLRDNYKKTTPMKMVKGYIDRSPFFRDMKSIKNKLFSNVSKGTFYKREDFDFGFGDMGDSGDFYSDDNYEEGGSWDATGDSYDGDSSDIGAESTAVAGANVANAVVGAAEGQATLTIEAMKAIHADRQIILTSINSTIEKGFVDLGSSMKIMTDGADLARDYYTKSMKYYEDNMSMIKDIKGLMLKNILDDEEQQQSRKERNYMDYMMTGDFRGAFGDAGKRIMKEGDGRFFGNMGSIIASSMPMLMMSMKQDPFSAIKMGVKGGMDKLFGFDSMDRITDTISDPGKFMNSLSRKLSLSDNGVASFIGDALRIRETPHDSIDTAQWGKRGRVYFDGITRQTIVEVIPTYLRKITAALTSSEEASYNYNSGKFQTMSEVKQTFTNSKPVFEETHAPSLSGLIKANANKAFAENIDDNKLAELSKVIVKRLAENMYTLSDIGVMNYKQFMGITQLPDSALADDEFATIKNAIIKASTNSNEADNRLFDRIDKSMDNYRNEIDAFYKQMQTTSRNTGLINLINGSTKINPFNNTPSPVEALGDKLSGEMTGSKANDFTSDDYYSGLNVNKKVDKLKDLSIYDEKEYANEEQRENDRIFTNKMSKDERESAALYYNKYGIKDYYKSRAIGNTNLKFVDKTGLGKLDKVKELREQDPNNMRKAKNYMSESLAKDEDEAKEVKRKDEVAGKVAEFKQKVADIQANGDMSTKDKTAAMKKLVSTDFKDYPEVRGLIGGAMVKVTEEFGKAFGGEDSTKNIMKLGGGALATFIGLKFLKKNLPKAGMLGIVGKAAGIGSVLAPVALASTAIAGTIYAGRNHIKRWMGADEDTSLFQATKEWMFGDGTEENPGIVGKATNKIKAGWTSMGDWVLTKGWKPMTEAMSKPFEGMMESVKGFWEDNIKTTMSSMTASVFDPIKEGFTKYVITPAGDALKAVTSKIGGFFGGMFSGIKGMFDSFRKPKSRGETLREKYGETRRAGKFAEFDSKVKEKFGSGYGMGAHDISYGKDKPKDQEHGMGYFYSQNDKKWSKLMIGGKGDSTASAKLSGCGLMAMAMAVSNIMDTKITPSDISGVARKHKVTNDGIPFSFFEDVSRKFELPVGLFNKSELSSNAVKGLLAKGHNIIALITTEVNTLHYVLLTKGKGNQVTVSDPDKGKSKTRPLALMHAMAKTFVVVYNDKKSSADSDVLASIPPKRKESLASRFKNALRGGAIEKEIYSVKSELAKDNVESVSGVIGGEGKKDGDGSAANGGKKSFIDSSSERINARSSLKIRETMLKSAKDNRLGFKSIRREIATSLNGVSFNMEYIKRLLAKKFGPLKESESPNASYFKNIFAARSGGVMFKLKNFIGGIKDSVLSKIYDVYIGTKMLMEETIDTIMTPFRIIGKGLSKIKDIGAWIGESIAKPFKAVAKGMGKVTKFILDPKDGLLPKLTGALSFGFRSVFDGIIGTEKNPGFIRKGWRTIFGHGENKGLLADMLGGATTLVKDMWSGLYGTKDKPGILRNIGSTLLGAANGAIGLLGKGLGAGYKWATGKNLGIGKGGIKKVQVVGGHIDTVGSMGVLGSIDMDAYKDVNRTITQKDSKLRQKLRKFTNTKGMREADKVQDKQEEITLAASIINAKDNKKDKEKKDGGMLGTIGNMLKMALPALIAGLSFLTMTKNGHDIVEKGYDMVGADGKSNADRISYQAPKGATKWAIKKYGKKGMSVAKGIGNIGSKVGKGTSWVGKKIGGMLKGTKIGSTVADAVASNKSKIATGAKNIGGKAIKAIVSGLSGIFSSKAVTKVLGPEVTEKILKGIPKLAKIGLKNTGKNSAKLSTRLLTWIPGIGQALDAMFFAYDLTSGMMGAPSMFGVSAEDVTFGMRMTAGIVKAIQGFAMSKGPLFVVGLIPTEMLAKFFYGLIGDKDELARLQQHQKEHDANYVDAAKKYKDRTGKDLDKKDFDDGKIDKNGEKVGFFKRIAKSMNMGGDKSNSKGGKSYGGTKTPYTIAGGSVNRMNDANGTKGSISENEMLDVSVDDAKRHEGWRNKVYMDTTGHRTVGYGFNIEVMPKAKRDKYITNGMNKEEGEGLLRKKISEVWSDIKGKIPWVKSLDGARQSVLVNMGYNMGVPGLLRWKNTLGMVKSGLYGKAADAMRGSLWARQVKGRATELSNTMESGIMHKVSKSTSKPNMVTQQREKVVNTNKAIENVKPIATGVSVNSPVTKPSTLADHRTRRSKMVAEHSKVSKVKEVDKPIPKETVKAVTNSGMVASSRNMHDINNRTTHALSLREHRRRKQELIDKHRLAIVSKDNSVSVDNTDVVSGIDGTNELLRKLIVTIDNKDMGSTLAIGGSNNIKNKKVSGTGDIRTGSDDYMKSIVGIVRG